MDQWISDRRAAVLAAVLAVVAIGLSPSPLVAGLKVPEGFQARLVASVPTVEFPSQLATSPDGSLFVAEDPMDQRGPHEAFNGRILRFVEGQPPRPFAEGFRAIQGMAWHEGALYVCHMPFLTVVKDTNGDGIADSKVDLFRDLGPTNNQGLNDHIVSGIQFGMDGWLYISVGDKGVPGTVRPEDGEVVQLRGGGVLRCRADGRGLEVFSRGTRNHLEANLDELDRVFTYDNTDDGDGWWTRVTYHIDGGYYGYPYDYHDHPERFLPRMAEYGGGSPCGAVFYREDAWPDRFQGIGLWAEWGKGKVHAFRFAPKGAGFEVAEAIDFVTAGDERDFRPIDLALSTDGKTLYIADWHMSGWSNRTATVGRVWAITYNGPAPASPPRGTDADPIDRQIAQLDHPALAERMRAQAALVRRGRDAVAPVTTAMADPATPSRARRHLLWALDALAGGTPDATMPILAQLDSNDAVMRAQAARALGHRRVPIAVEPLLKVATDQDAPARLQAAIALGRIGDAEAVRALLPMLAEEDPYIAFAAREALRRIGDWEAVARGRQSADPKVREGIRLAAEGIYDERAAALLAEVARDGQAVPAERALALIALAEVEKQAEPWDGRWWGTRPSQGGPPPKIKIWASTELVRGTIAAMLEDPEGVVRYAAIAAVEVTKDRDLAETRLRTRFEQDPSADVRAAIALALGKLNDRGALPSLSAALRSEDTPEAVRDAALSAISSIGTDEGIRALVALLDQGKLSAARAVKVIDTLGRLKSSAATAALLGALKQGDALIQEAAVEALGEIGPGASGALPSLLARLEPNAGTSLALRKGVINAIGNIGNRDAVPALLVEAGREPTRFEATLALAKMADVRGLPVLLRGLIDANLAIRTACAKAITSIRDEVAPTLDQLAARKELSPRIVAELRKIYSGMKPIISWKVLGPFERDTKAPFDVARSVNLDGRYSGRDGKEVSWAALLPSDPRGQIDLGKRYGTTSGEAYAVAEVTSAEAREAELAIGSDDSVLIWLNGRLVFEFKGDRGFQHAQDRVSVSLRAGKNQLLVLCGNTGGPWQFAVGASETARHAFLQAPAAGAFDPEAFRAFALKNGGDVDRGRALFADEKGLACAKCHAVRGEGGQVGPDLAGIGSRYPREDLITSVLYPSERMLSGYEAVVVATADGRVLTGVLKADTPEALEIQDADAQRIRISAEEIDERKTSPVSLMPSGLAEGLTPQSFVDLIAYLGSLKESSVQDDSAQ